MRGLMEQISALPIEEKGLLLVELSKQVERESLHMAEQTYEKVDNLKSRVCKILDIPEIDFSRWRPNVVARILMTQALFQMGMTENRIGTLLHLNHSTINHYKRVFNSWKSLPMAYKTELDYWNQICETL